MRMPLLLLTLASAALAACQSAEPVRLKAAVDADDLSPYRVAGSSRVFGQALLRQSGGAVVTCAGEEAALVPAVSLMDEAMKIWGSGEEIDPDGIDGKKVSGAIRWSRCDAQGNFVFDAVPALPYWLIAPVRWRAAKDQPQGGTLARRIAPQRQGEQRVILSQHDVGYLKAKPWQVWNAGD